MAVVRVSPGQASHMLAEGGFDLVDVRQAFEWSGGHLPGARHVPLAELMRHPRSHLQQDRVIFVCAHGVRSLTAGAVAEGQGLCQVFSLDGGVLAWIRLGFPLEWD
jgi:rhodanese-related sulfurtransferase